MGIRVSLPVAALTVKCFSGQKVMGGVQQTVIPPFEALGWVVFLELRPLDVLQHLVWKLQRPSWACAASAEPPESGVFPIKLVCHSTLFETRYVTLRQTLSDRST